MNSFVHILVATRLAGRVGGRFQWCRGAAACVVCFAVAVRGLGVVSLVCVSRRRADVRVAPSFSLTRVHSSCLLALSHCRRRGLTTRRLNC